VVVGSAHLLRRKSGGGGGRRRRSTAAILVAVAALQVLKGRVPLRSLFHAGDLKVLVDRRGIDATVPTDTAESLDSQELVAAPATDRLRVDAESLGRLTRGDPSAFGHAAAFLTRLAEVASCLMVARNRRRREDRGVTATVKLARLAKLT
jgi:hypothetical protein